MSTIHRFFLVLTLLLFVWAFSLAYKEAPYTVLESQIELKQNNENSCFSHSHPVEVDEGNFVIIESEPEFEIKLNWFTISFKFFNIFSPSLKENSNSNTALFFFLSETIPLYDLYCKWKFDLV